jgi:hypothetical protein
MPVDLLGDNRRPVAYQISYLLPAVFSVAENRHCDARVNIERGQG